MCWGAREGKPLLPVSPSAWRAGARPASPGGVGVGDDAKDNKSPRPPGPPNTPQTPAPSNRPSPSLLERDCNTRFGDTRPETETSPKKAQPPPSASAPLSEREVVRDTRSPSSARGVGSTAMSRGEKRRPAERPRLHGASVEESPTSRRTSNNKPLPPSRPALLGFTASAANARAGGCGTSSGLDPTRALQGRARMLPSGGAREKAPPAFSVGSTDEPAPRGVRACSLSRFRWVQHAIRDRDARLHPPECFTPAAVDRRRRETT